MTKLYCHTRDGTTKLIENDSTKKDIPIGIFFFFQKKGNQPTLCGVREKLGTILKSTVSQNKLYFDTPFDPTLAVTQEGYFEDYFIFTPSYLNNSVLTPCARTQYRFSQDKKDKLTGLAKTIFKGIKFVFKCSTLSMILSEIFIASAPFTLPIEIVTAGYSELFLANFSLALPYPKDT